EGMTVHFARRYAHVARVLFDCPRRVQRPLRLACRPPVRLCWARFHRLEFVMHATLRLLTLPALAMLTACVHQSGTLELKKDRQCPLTLNRGQQLILSLPSNPTTGFRWEIRDDAAKVL